MKVRVDSNNILIAYGDDISDGINVDIPSGWDDSFNWQLSNGVLIPYQRLTAQQLAQIAFDTAITEGYTYNNITIAIDDDSLTAFAKQLQLLQLAGATDTTTVAFADINGNLVSLAFSDYKNLLLGAGQRYLTLWVTNKQAGN